MEESNADIGKKRWEETLGLLGTLEDLLDNSANARKQRVNKVKERIEQGKSFLVPQIIKK